MDGDTLRRARAAAQGLYRAGPAATTPADLVAGLLAVQAQDLRAARLALRARGAGLIAADVDAALAGGSLSVGWLARGTLHLVATEDYGWLLGLTAPTRRSTSARRLAQEGVSPDAADRAVAIVARALADDGPLSRAALAERIAGAGIRTAGQATPHLLMLAALRGAAMLGPVAGDGAQAYVLARDRLGAEPPTTLEGDARDRALAELARRHLAAHGPASAADLAAWSGLPLRDARAGLGAIAASLRDAGGDRFDLAGREPPPRRAVPARLLAAFDPYMLGWKDRGFAVPAEHARTVHPGGGLLRAVATVDGEAVGTWTRAPRSGVPRIELFTSLTVPASAALDAEAAEIVAFEAAERR